MFLRKAVTSASAVIAVSAIVLSTTAVYAASSGIVGAPGSGNGMRVSPVRSDLVIKPGSSQTIDVYVQNLTNKTATLQGIVDDFVANPNETGTPAILLNGEKAPSHSLKGYVEPISDFTLAPSATQDVKVTINIPAGTAGGGYFGAVRFAPATANTDKNVNLTASVGSLLLVTVPGKIVQQMDIASFDVRQVDAKANTTISQPSVLFTSNKNLGAVVRFENTGNLQEAPFGNVILKKGKKVLNTYQVNNIVPRGDVLPDSIRHFIVPLTGLGSLGRYTIVGNFGYGTTGQLLSAQTSFYIVPIAAIIIAIVVVLILLLLIFGVPRMIRAHDRSVVRKASRPKPKTE